MDSLEQGIGNRFVINLLQFRLHYHELVYYFWLRIALLLVSKIVLASLHKLANLMCVCFFDFSHLLIK